MTYHLEIAHPNEIIHRRWKHVGDVESPEELQDALAFPVFEVYDGLIAQARFNNNELSSQTWVYGGGSFYDIGPYSDIAMKINWKTTNDMFTYDNRWVMSEDGTELALLMDLIVPQRYNMAVMLEMLKQDVVEYGINNRILKNGLKDAQGYIDGNVTKSRMEFHSDQLAIEGDSTTDRIRSNYYYAAYALCEVENETFGPQMSRWASNMIQARTAGTILPDLDFNTRRGIQRRRLASEIRTRVPFYDIAVRLVSHVA